MALNAGWSGSSSPFLGAVWICALIRSELGMSFGRPILSFFFVLPQAHKDMLARKKVMEGRSEGLFLSITPEASVFRQLVEGTEEEKLPRLDLSGRRPFFYHGK